MKIFLSLSLAIVLSSSIYGQVFKLRELFYSTDLNLTHWQIIEQKNTEQTDSFQLWGEHRYDQSWMAATYEVEYFKGDARSTFSFLNELISSFKKYKNEKNILLIIDGVQVKFLSFDRVRIYDKERKVYGTTNLNRLTEMRDSIAQISRKKDLSFD